MTKAKAFKRYVKKIYGIDLDGMSIVAALKDFVSKKYNIDPVASTVSGLLDSVSEGVDVVSDTVALSGLIDRSITGINIPSTVSGIGADVFNGCKQLESVEMPTVTAIGNQAFKGCTSLKSVSMPAIISIGSQVFNGCSSLKEIHLGVNCKTIDSYAFYNIPVDVVINCDFLESAVSGAPWGAPEGVIINYDVTND